MTEPDDSSELSAEQQDTANLRPWEQRGNKKHALE